MALHWQWKDKCGEVVLVRTYPDEKTEEFTVNIYQGNAFLIFLYEFVDKDTGKNMYNLFSFFNDEEHAKRCLGLDKEYGNENIFDNGIDKLVRLRLDKSRFTYKKDFKKVLELFIKAFDELTIEFYKEEEK